jgi:hypothetical protein
MLGIPMLSKNLIHVDRWGPGPIAGLVLLSSTFVLAHCRKGVPEESAQPTAAAKSAPLPTASAIPPLAASQRPPAHETPFAGQDLRAGKWIETSAYKFKVNGVVRCTDPGPTEKVPEDRRLRVAVNVEIFSKYDEFLAHAKDVELEKDGVIIDSERQVKTGPECSPLLEHKRMKHDETLRGFVVFQVPDEAFVRGGTVAYMPTRWGSAPKTEVKLDAKLALGKK